MAARKVSSLTPLLLGCLNGWMGLSFEKGNHCRGRECNSVFNTLLPKCLWDIPMQVSRIWILEKSCHFVIPSSACVCLPFTFFWIFPYQPFKHFQDFSSFQTLSLSLSLLKKPQTLPYYISLSQCPTSQLNFQKSL